MFYITLRILSTVYNIEIGKDIKKSPMLHGRTLSQPRSGNNSKRNSLNDSFKFEPTPLQA